MPINNFIKAKLLCLGTTVFLMLPLTYIHAQEPAAEESVGITPAPIYENKNLKKPEKPNPPELPEFQEKPSEPEPAALPPKKQEEKPSEPPPKNPAPEENPKPQVKKEMKKAKPIKKTPPENTSTEEASNNTAKNSDITEKKEANPETAYAESQEKNQQNEKEQALPLPEITDSEISLYDNSLIEIPENNAHHKNIIQTLGAWLLIIVGLPLIIKGVLEDKKNSKNHKLYKQNFRKFNSQF